MFFSSLKLQQNQMIFGKTLENFNIESQIVQKGKSISILKKSPNTYKIPQFLSLGDEITKVGQGHPGPLVDIKYGQGLAK